MAAKFAAEFTAEFTAEFNTVLTPCGHSLGNDLACLTDRRRLVLDEHTSVA
jgi:hypothetical protein